jgi:hypothetical protein
MKAWFEQQNQMRWLLVFDNADKVTKSLVDMIPRGKNGCVLITSRNQESDRELATGGCEVNVMKELEATELLLGSARYKEQDEQDSKNLVSILGYLPLAIEQAASYIHSRRMSVARYITIYETNKSDLLQRSLPLSHEVYYHETVATTGKSPLLRSKNKILSRARLFA